MEESLKGSAGSGTLNIIVPGGTVGNEKIWIDDSPAFNQGEKAVIFLSALTSERLAEMNTTLPLPLYEVFGWYQGKLDIIQDTAGGMPLADLKGMVGRIVNGESGVVCPELTSGGPAGLEQPGYVKGTYRWEAASPNVPYYIHTSFTAAQRIAIQNSAATWSGAGANFTFNYAGTHSRAGGKLRNGVNEIIWADLGSGATLGLASSFMSGVDSAHMYIVECDTEFNTQKTFSTSTPPTTNDFESISLHEFGHWLNLGHSGIEAAIMYYSITTGTAKRVLNADDVAGIKAIYGAQTGTVPGAPTLTSPANGAAVSGASATFAWSAGTGSPTQYQLQVNSNSSFTGTNYYDLQVSGTSQTVTGLPNNGSTLYWHVRAYNAAGWGPYAGYRSFVNGAVTAPGAPTLSSPADGASVPGASASFTWAAGTGSPTKYFLQVNSSSLFTGTNYHYAEVSGASKEVTTLPNNGATLYWRVQAGNAGGWGAWSASRNFINSNGCTKPGAPSLSSPANGVTAGGASVTFTWAAGTGSPTKYWLQVNSSSAFTGTSYYYADVGAVTSQLVSGLPANGSTLYWRVQAYNVCGWGTWSATGNLVNSSNVPGAPTLSSPANGATVSGASTTFTWAAGTGTPTKYFLEVNSSNTWGTATRIYYADVGAVTSKLVTTLPAGGATLYWRVQPYNAAGWGAWSATRNFINDSGLPSAPTIFAPANGANVGGILATPQVTFPDIGCYLEWAPGTGHPTKQQLQVSTSPSFAGTEYDYEVRGDLTIEDVGWFPAGVTHYWRVRSGNAYGWGPWSATGNFIGGQTVSGPPPAPRGVSNIGRNSGSWWGNFTILYWTPSENATRCWVEMNSSPTWNPASRWFFAEADSSTKDAFGMWHQRVDLPEDGHEYFTRVWTGSDKGWCSDDSATATSVYCESSYNRDTMYAESDILWPPVGAHVPGTSVPLIWYKGPSYDSLYFLEVNTSNTWGTATRLFYGDVGQLARQTYSNPCYEVSGLPNDGSTIYWRVRVGYPGLVGVHNWGPWHDSSFVNGPSTSVPPAPAVSTLANGETILGPSAMLVWNASPGATKYWLQVNSSPSFSGTNYYYGDVGNVTSKVVTGLPADGSTLYRRVQAGNTFGWSPWSSTFSFINGCAAPGAPALSSPANGISVPGPSATFTWAAGTGSPTKYWLEVNSSNTWGTGTRLYYAEVTGTSHLVDNLPNNGSTLYWRVQAGACSSSWSPWSTSRSFTNSACTLPGAPTLSTPANGATVSGAAVTFTWAAGSGSPTSYLLEVNYSDLFDSGSRLHFDEVSGTSHLVDNLTGNGSPLYWRVQPHNTCGWGTWSATRNLINGSGPSAPTLSSPADGASVTGASGTFTWAAGTGSPTEYWLQINSNASFTGTNYHYANVGNVTSQLITTLPNNGITLYWRVQARNATGWGSWSASRNFINTMGAPPAPSLVAPNGATARIRWNATSGATKYFLEVNTSPSWSTAGRVFNSDVGNVTAMDVSGIPVGVRCYWRLWSGDGSGYSAAATVGSSFILGATTTPTGITITSPTLVNLTWDRGSNQAITWTYTGGNNATVKIELLKGGVLSSTLATAAAIGSGGSGSWNWAIPAAQALGSDYKIRLTTSNSLTSTSANNFTIQGQQKIRVELTWVGNATTLLRDVDTMFYSPTGGLCYYSTKTPDWGTYGHPVLNRDSGTSGDPGNGPEIMTLSDPGTGTYNYKAKYYNDRDTGATDVTAKLWINGVLRDTRTQSIANDPQVWNVWNIAWSGTDATVTYTGGVAEPPAGEVQQAKPEVPSGQSLQEPIPQQTVIESAVQDVEPIISGATAAPTLVGPAGATMPFKWNAASSATKYLLEVNTSPSWTTGGRIYYGDVGNVTVIDVAGIPTETSCYWRLWSGNSIGYSATATTGTTFILGSCMPGAPTLSSPANGATVTGASGTFTWAAGTGNPTKYWLQINSNSSFTGTNYYYADVGNVTSKLLTTLPNNGSTLYWRVQPYNTCGWGTWSASRYFTNARGVPGAPTLISPANAATLTGTSGTFTWAAGSGSPTKYWLQINSNSSFTGTNYYNADVGAVTSKLVTTLPNNGSTLYWRVQPYNAYGWGTYSASRYFINAVGAPGAPTLISPANAATVAGASGTFTWTAGTGSPTKYWLQINSNSSFTGTNYYYADVGNVTSKLVTTLPNNGGTLYWRVQPYNAYGWGTWSASRYFTNAPGVPGAPTLISPANAATVAGTSGTFTWTAGSGSPTKYWLQINSNSSFTGTNYYYADVGNVTSKLVTTLPNNGSTLYWRVQPYNAYGWGVWSASRYFTNTICTLPGTPALLTPANGATVLGTSTTLDWDVPTGSPTKYHLQISRNTAFTDLAGENNALTTSGSDVTGLPNNGSTRYWKVRAYNACGWGAWSGYRSFISGASLPTSITITQPTLVNLTWDRGSTQYINWTYAGGNGATVTIDLMKDGAWHKTLATGVAIGSSGSGSWTWAIPSDQGLGTTFRVRLTTSNSKTSTSAYNFTIQGQQSIRVELTWLGNTTTLLRDVDTMFYSPTGGLCYYDVKAPNWGTYGHPVLNRDSGTSSDPGTGPEIMTLSDPGNGTYNYKVYYYTDNSHGATTATAKIWINGTLRDTRSLSISHHQTWYVWSIAWSGTTATVTYNGTVSEPPAGGPPPEPKPVSGSVTVPAAPQEAEPDMAPVTGPTPGGVPQEVKLSDQQ